MESVGHCKLNYDCPHTPQCCCIYNPVESTEDFGDFGLLPQLNATIQNEADKVPVHNNVNNKVPQSVIDAINVSMDDGSIFWTRPSIAIFVQHR